MRINNFFYFIYIELLFITLLIKAFNLSKFTLHSDFYYGFFQVIFHDALIFFLIILLMYISSQKFIVFFINIIIRFLIVILTILYIIDIFILFKFVNRLNFEDTLKYSSYTLEYLIQNNYLNLLNFLFFLIIIFIIILFIFSQYKIKGKVFHYLYLFSLLFLLSIYQFSENDKFVHSWIYKNFINYNMEIYSQSKEYSKDFLNNFKFKEKYICEKNEIEKKNIIILMVESLSNYQSNHFSGIKSWTPNLDLIAKNNISLLNFYSNGFITEDAEISILTGKLPLTKPSFYSIKGGVSFKGFYNIKDTLPKIFNKEGYNTEFITSSDLEFSNTGNWAKNLGFNYIEGSEHDLYNNKQRYHFNAAADEYLYKRVLKRINNQDSNFFMFIKTVSSHAPFTNPENNSNSEEETIKYVDKQIGLFYNTLKEKNFFKNGILIIVGDHYPMIPIKDELIKMFGKTQASLRVPMILIQGKEKKIISEQFQHIDIFNSLKNLVSKNLCISDFKGDFIKRNIPPKFIFHKRGDKRNIISCISKKEEFNIKLNGDKTKFEEKTNKANQILIDYINYSRINKD